MAQPEVQNEAGLEELLEPATTTPVYFTLKPQVLVGAPKASEAVKFYKAAFGAEEVARTTLPKRKADQELPHISVKLFLGGSTIVVADVDGDYVPRSSLETGVALNLETTDVLNAVKKAVEAGGDAVGEITVGTVTEEKCGCVVGRVVDPYGVLWIISSFPDEELAALAAEMEA